MKLIYEGACDVVFERDINEASGGKSIYKISGIFSTIGEKNKNGRVYPAHIWEREVNEYQKVLESGGSNSLMELNHPPRANVEMMEAVAKITKLYIKGKYVMGEAVLLDNKEANQLKTLIDNGIKMSVSSRGVGKVSATGVVENFKLSTYDIIPDQGQSDYNAQMMGIVEGVLLEKEFEIKPDGCVGECELPINETDEYENVRAMRKILEKKGVSVLCDLSKADKEEVLKEFKSGSIQESVMNESVQDLSDELEIAEERYKNLQDKVKSYEKYAKQQYKELQEKYDELEYSLRDEVLKEEKLKEIQTHEKIKAKVGTFTDFFDNLAKS